MSLDSVFRIADLSLTLTGRFALEEPITFILLGAYRRCGAELSWS